MGRIRRILGIEWFAVHEIGTRCRRNSGGGAGPLRRAVAFFREAVVLLGDACDIALLGLHAS